MGTNKHRYAPWSLYGLLILAYFGNVCFGQKTAKEYAATSGDLSCFVCNSVLGKCKGTEDDLKMKCKDDYFKTVYGDQGNSDEPLNRWPSSLSEMSSKGSGAGNIGWSLGGYPSAFENGVKILDKEDTHRISSFENLVHDPTDSIKLENGFKSCRVMKITVESQLNGNKRGEIPKTEPRVIRTCSFVNADEKIGKEPFNEHGCRLFNYKTAAVEVCYCKDNDCNASPHLHGSYWMIAAPVLVLLARIF